MVFLSIDQDIAKWANAKYPIFNEENSFMVGHLKNSKLVKTYELDKVVPRVLLVNGNKLAELDVDKHLLIPK
jgi:hypothetical protein